MNIKMILDNGFDPDVRVYNEAKFFVNKGHDVEIICYDGRSKYADHPEEIIDGIRIKRFFLRSKLGTFLTDKISFKFHLIFYTVWFIKFYFKIHIYLKQEKHIDYIYSHDLKCGFMSTLFFKRYKKVFDMHEFYQKTTKHKFYNYIMQKIMNYVQRKSDFIIYVNDTQKQHSISSLHDKFLYLPNYAITSKYTTKKIESELFVISYIGLVRRDDLILNLCEATINLSNCEVRIYGTGLSKQGAVKVNNYSHAHYYGAFDGTKEASKLFSECKLLYSVYDISNLNWKTAYPVKFYEAIASGTPVIASNDTLYGKLVKEKNLGYVVDWNSIDQIRVSILNAIKDKNEYEIKRKNCLELRNDFSWEVRIFDIIKELEDYAKKSEM